MVREKQQRHSGQFRGKLQEEPPLKQPCPCLSLLAHQRNPVDFTGEFSLWVEQERIELPPEGFTLRKDGEVTRTRTLQRLGIRPHTIGDEIDDRSATRTAAEAVHARLGHVADSVDLEEHAEERGPQRTE